MTAASVKGWCPGAWRPMQSGDGLLVRIRPRGGRLDPRQAAGLAELAARHGNGLIDVTIRANLQVRGVSEQSHPALIEGLAELGLLDPDPESEARRNVLVMPFWRAGDGIYPLACELEQALTAASFDLPAKFGFAVDCGPQRLLAGSSADIRIERAATGGLIVRADGAPLGLPVARQEAVEGALKLAEWFAADGGAAGGRGRMAAHLGSGAKLPGGLAGAIKPAGVAPLPGPALCEAGAIVGAAFGQLDHAALRCLAESANGLRVTPWRMILAEAMTEMPHHAGLVTDARDPILRVVACSGAPACQSAHADTRSLAARLAPQLAPGARLHVSGCAKGCAHRGAQSVTLVATSQGFDLIRDGSPQAAPVLRGLSIEQMLHEPSLLMGAR